MAHLREIQAEFNGVKEIAKGDSIWSLDPISVGETSQVGVMQSCSLDDYGLYRTYRTDKCAFTDIKFKPCQAGTLFGPVLAHEIIPAPPHQYLGLTTVANGPGREPIVLITSHNWYATHKSQTKVQNASDGEELVKVYGTEEAAGRELTSWDKQVLIACIRAKE